MAQHSSIVGGSNAGRLLACPGSYQAILALPATADIPSEYALEGTFAHEVMADLMRARQQGAPWAVTLRAPALLVKEQMEFADRVITQAHVDEMIQPALHALAELEQIHGGNFQVLGIEQRVTFPGVPGAFGTVDLILVNRPTCCSSTGSSGRASACKAVYADARARWSTRN